MNAVSLASLTNALRYQVCGAKAANLAALNRFGYRVPAGFVITDDTYQRHLQNIGIARECRRLLADLGQLEIQQIRDRSAAIHSAIASASIEAELIDSLIARMSELGMGWPLIFRSSAASEDSYGASFAGQLDSVPGVTSRELMAEALQKVWSSPWSDRCLTYTRRKGAGSGALGVIVQEQVHARFSGVLFTRDPRGGAMAGNILVECVAGMGDRLASGEVTPLRASVSRDDFAIYWESDNSGHVADTQLESAICELARVSLEIERKLAAPQDIEWCTDQQNYLVLLQARPITVNIEERPVEVWSNANIAENFPHPVPPLVFSIVSRGYSAYFRNLGLGFGLSQRRIAAMSESFARIVGLHGERLYYNLSNIHTVLYLAPFGARLAAWFNQFTGAREFPRPEKVVVGRGERVFEACRIVVMVFWQYLLIKRRVTAFEKCVDDYAAGTDPSGLTEQRLERLGQHFEDFLDIRVNRWNNAALADAAAMVCYGLLQHVLADAASGGAEYAQPNDLLKGIPGLVSTRPVVELWKLSRVARANVELCSLILKGTPQEVADSLIAGRFADFSRHFNAYLRQWGFRYSGELTLIASTPQEDPLPLLRMLRSYVADDGNGPELISREQEHVRIAATRRLAECLTPQVWLRWSSLSRAGRFRIVLRCTQGAIQLRERARMKQALLYTRLRHVLLHIGRSFTAFGWLPEPDAIFFLAPEEILDAIRIGGLQIPFEAMLAERKRNFEMQSHIRLPDSFALPVGEVWREGAAKLSEGSGPESLQDQDAVMCGASACGGSVEGDASVVLDVADSDTVQAGQILVTRQTDPGWAAVFFLVKGLVIERGGMLSHGAIIAREYGIPTVIGVPNATQRIRNGQRVHVNGDQGVVRLVRV